LTKIITIFITILNTINKLIWKIICWLSNSIKVDEFINSDSKTDNVRYRHFKVDDPAFDGPFKPIDKPPIIKSSIIYKTFLLFLFFINIYININKFSFNFSK